MTKEEIQERYKALILPENKNPYHFSEEKREVNIEAYNPMCGDKYELHLDESGDNIKEISFHGIGCAMSKASTSLLLKEIEGKSKGEVKELCKQFISAICDDGDASSLSEGLQVLAELKNFDGRVDCIQLSWKALLEHLEKSK